MLIEKVQRILARSVEEVISSPLSLDLLECYSKLYINGAQPRSCAGSMRKYYAELTKTGVQKAMELNQTKERTCKPAWKGLKYIIVKENDYAAKGMHVSSEHITDEQAKKYLRIGALVESDFEILPENVKLKSVGDEVKESIKQIAPKKPRQPRKKK
mgnify:CR=1 FL=1